MTFNLINSKPSLFLVYLFKLVEIDVHTHDVMRSDVERFYPGAQSSRQPL